MSSDAANPIEDPQAWDHIYVGQTKSPLCKVTGFKRQYEWDKKTGKGTKGSTTTFVGQPAVNGTVTFYLWRVQDFVAWAAFRKLLKYDPTKKNVEAIDIWYPSLADIDVKSVTTEEIGAIEHEGQGMYSVTIALLEYLPPPKKSATSTPSGSKTTQKGTTPGTPTDPVADAQQKEIAELLKKAAEP